MRVVRTKTVYGVGSGGSGELCRLCGAQEDRMLHLDDTFSVLDAASSIIRLLGSIAVYLKVQDDCEVLMPKRLCVSCLNTAVDIQTFVNSGINFQKTTIRQLFPDAKVEDIFSVTDSEAVPKNLVVGEGPQFVKQDTLTDDITGKQSQGILNSCSVEKDGSELPRQETYTVQDHGNFWPAKEDVCNQNDNTESYRLGLSQKGYYDTNVCVIKSEQGIPQTENYHGISRNENDQCSFSAENEKSITLTESDQGISVTENNQGISITENEKSIFLTETNVGISLTKNEQGNSLTERPIISAQPNTGTYNETLPSSVQPSENVPRQSLETEGTLDPENTKEIVLNTGNSTTDCIATNPKRANKQGFECSECKVVVLCKSSLRRHMTTVHAASNKYTCPHCSKGFNNYQNYQGHVRRHTGERPYGCPHCNKTFTTTKALTRHTATHGATRAHKCPECNKGFLEMCDLKKHLRRHQQRKQQQRIRSRESATPNTTPVDTEMNSINLMVLNDPLLFDQSHQLLDSPGSKVTEVILQHDKLESCKEVSTEPVLEPNSLLEDGNKDRVQEPPSLELPSEAVLTSSTLLSPPPSVSLLAETQVMAPIPEPLDPTQVLNSADIHVHQVVSDGDSEVTLPSQDSSGCRSVSDATTMVVLSSIHTPSEFMSVPAAAAAAAATAAGPENTSETSNSVIDGDGHQEGQRILSHATW
ncbi:hypothetical protein Pmani_009800 [Petrolisthes manimaculis]|uniref:C2H2-type domain-containing protein n=1 Tax=Petrolisthes manimaculis TaxID=1843537 RepID=A0AAE1UHD3_9EUCA|nr:hypothetical protein Pmani_009800 [Petrolisthes manimaculis]